MVLSAFFVSLPFGSRYYFFTFSVRDSVRMKLNFRLDSYYADKSGECPVFIDCTYDGQRLKMSAGLKCLPKDWDAKKMRLRRSAPEFLSGNNLLDSLESRIRAVYRESLANGFPSLAHCGSL
ncbi:Arm DNA-binding domain-containing protein [Runella sp.]|uniref:Arm DNA-binding domain-containing protein n=1 Tax=Runella sp. TaxID=1960881 RepID=UPI003D0DD81A